jgi:hypothetical protein
MRVPLIETAALVDGRVSDVNFFGRSVLGLRTDERVRAYVNVCTHLGGPLELSAKRLDLSVPVARRLFRRSLARPNAPARPDTHLMHLPIKIDDGQVTYVYSELTSLSIPRSQISLRGGARPNRRRALRLTARGHCPGWESR